MTTTFETSLHIALDKIKKPEWHSPLLELAKHFNGLPEHDINFDDELLNLLWSLQTAVEADPNIPIETLMAIRISRLNSWTMRAYKVAGGQHIPWNPITEHFDQFKDDTTEVIQAATAYPAEDIVKRWSKDSLR